MKDAKICEKCRKDILPNQHFYLYSVQDRTNWGYTTVYYHDNCMCPNFKQIKIWTGNNKIYAIDTKYFCFYNKKQDNFILVNINLIGKDEIQGKLNENSEFVCEGFIENKIFYEQDNPNSKISSFLRLSDNFTTIEN